MDADLPRTVETVIVGAGHAGLTMSWFLREAGREHVVLDRREQLGGGWQDRWDGFRLVSPNWTTALPGFDYDGTDPDGFMPRDEIVDRMRRYAAAIDAPVRLGTTVRRLSAADSGAYRFRLETDFSPQGDQARAIERLTAGLREGRFDVFRLEFGILADLAARTAIRPEEIPVGAVTALLGGPFFLYLLRRERRAAGAGA